MNAFLPGFERSGGLAVSNRKTSDDLGSTEASPDFRSDVAKGSGVLLPLRTKGFDSTDTLATPHGCGDGVFLVDKEKGFGVSVPLAAKVPISHRTLDSTEVNTADFSRGKSIQHPPLSMRAVDFRVSAFARSLSPQERAAVARRRRFRNLPWVVLAGQDDTDELP